MGYDGSNLRSAVDVAVVVMRSSRDDVVMAMGGRPTPTPTMQIRHRHCRHPHRR